MDEYKIVIKPLKSLEKLPKMEGVNWEDDDNRYLCLQQHIYHIQALPLCYCIAVYGKSHQDVKKDFASAGRNMQTDWLLVMECKIIK